MFALSTVWNASRCVNGQTIVDQIAELGFKAIELNYTLDAHQVREIAQTAKQRHLIISSCHNYCPYPNVLSREAALPDAFSLSSLNEHERHRALAFTKETINTASRLKAKAVVLHCGRVEIEDKTRLLIELFNTEGNKTTTYQKTFQEAKKERSAKAKDFFEQILKSLEELLPYAQERQITLGIENRFYYREIPSFEECGVILDRFPDNTIAYWHDVGHAHILEQLGFAPEHAYLKHHHHRLFGIHLHDIQNLDDHQAALKGSFDFKKIQKFLTPKTIKVLEIHQQASSEDIKNSLAYFKEVFCD